VAQAVQQLANPPAAAQPVPDIPPQSPLFEQYEENLRKNEQAQRLDQARSSSRNLSNPKCQFWLQQDHRAQRKKSRQRFAILRLTMNKQTVHQLILDKLRRSRHRGTRRADRYETATHEENIAENKYDTLGLEASYLAAGETGRGNQAVTGAVPEPDAAFLR
jgi:hypothetical protein